MSREHFLKYGPKKGGQQVEYKKDDKFTKKNAHKLLH